jgi:hypothetical protein
MNLHLKEVFTMKRTFLLSIVFSLAVALSGCGGGGGGGGTSQPSAVVTLAATGNLQGNLIKAVDITIDLPAGVTVNATPSAANPSVLEPAPGVIVAAGSNIVASYVPANAGTLGKVHISLANSTGFGLGSFATINCVVAAGTASQASFVVTPATGGIFANDGVNDIELTAANVTASAVFH